MDRNAVVQQVREFVVSNYLFGRDDGLKSDVSFLDSGIIDSTGVLELVAFLEQTYGFKVRDEELITENLDSIDRVSTYVLSKLAPVQETGVR